ncbi:hypothetical protein F383_07602 [Gossypium arboreum]|uniref:Uncharacterized protein n=1 Tax=Gossypium arboreum TaxID=29729 RepID=A0A0B0PN67_GOSAR|nr:hypothetical protein F383_07602 [Gossypium arboreum]
MFDFCIYLPLFSKKKNPITILFKDFYSLFYNLFCLFVGSFEHVSDVAY